MGYLGRAGVNLVVLCWGHESQHEQNGPDSSFLNACGKKKKSAGNSIISVIESHWAGTRQSCGRQYCVAGASVEPGCVGPRPSPPGWETQVVPFSGMQGGLKGMLLSQCFCLGLFSTQTTSFMSLTWVLAFRSCSRRTQKTHLSSSLLHPLFFILTSSSEDESFGGFTPLGCSVAELRS